MKKLISMCLDSSMSTVNKLDNTPLDHDSLIKTAGTVKQREMEKKTNMKLVARIVLEIDTLHWHPVQFEQMF